MFPQTKEGNHEKCRHGFVRGKTLPPLLVYAFSYYEKKEEFRRPLTPSLLFAFYETQAAIDWSKRKLEIKNRVKDRNRRRLAKK